MQYIDSIDCSGKTILLRADYNVPIRSGQILSDFRIQASLPTIRYLLDQKPAKIIIISHLGRPDRAPSRLNQSDLSLRPIAIRLSELLNQKVLFAPTEQEIKTAPSPTVILLENLRFDSREEQDDDIFAKELITTSGADIFVQDGFAVLHRAHASTSAITEYLPSFAGLLIKKELTNLDQAKTPVRPSLLILGGNKGAEKLKFAQKLRYDQVALGSAFTNSPTNKNTPSFGDLPRASISSHTSVTGDLPRGPINSTADDYPRPTKFLPPSDFIPDQAGHPRDLGPISTQNILDQIKLARTVLWNGPLGQIEQEQFARSSRTIATAIGSQTDLFSIIIGGDTTGFVENLLKTNPNLHYSLLSTGGASALAYLSGEPLPGLEALNGSKT